MTPSQARKCEIVKKYFGRVLLLIVPKISVSNQNPDKTKNLAREQRNILKIKPSKVG